MTNLQVRILSGAVAAPVVLGAIYVGGFVFDLLVIAAAVLCVREWVRLVAPGRDDFALELSYGFLVAVLVADLAAGPLPGLALMVLLSLCLLTAMAARGRAHSRLIAFGIPYIGLASVALIWLRAPPDGGALVVVWLFAVVWATDIGGYAVGRTVGGPRLAPAISPNKTWSGLGGAVAGAALAGGLVAGLFGAAWPWVGAGLGGVLALVSQAGDLFESFIKRRYKVKDTGGLIPGHGGILDRLDGLIAAAPIFAAFQATVGREVQWW
ncbi:MAG: phosphatidate cytidylyltransferase [Inquilinaceae bacterium]